MKNALIAAVVAALVASGSTYAATRIDGHSIKPHSIPLNRLAERPTGKSGPQGPAGRIGPTGDQGPRGAIDLSRITRVFSESVAIRPGENNGVTAICPGNDVPVGGGGVTNGQGFITDSLPAVPIDEPATNPPVGWWVRATNPTSSPITIQAYAMCIAP